MTIQRDSQKSKVYKAERSLPDWKDRPWDAQVSRHVIQLYVDRLLAKRAVKNRFPGASCTVVYRSGGRHSFGDPVDRTIRLLPVHRFPIVVLHELAHVVSPRGERHNWQFADNYVFLVRQGMGDDAADRLKAALKANRVRMAPKRTRTITDDQRAALALRLSVARNKRQGELVAAKLDNPLPLVVLGARVVRALDVRRFKRYGEAVTLNAGIVIGVHGVGQPDMKYTVKWPGGHNGKHAPSELIGTPGNAKTMRVGLPAVVQSFTVSSPDRSIALARANEA